MNDEPRRIGRMVGTDPRLLSDVVAMLILQGPSDTVTFAADRQAELRRAFPDGFGLAGFQDEASGMISVRLLGSEAMALLHRVYDEFQDGKTDTLERLFERAAQPEQPGPGGE